MLISQLLSQDPTPSSANQSFRKATPADGLHSTASTTSGHPSMSPTAWPSSGSARTTPKHLPLTIVNSLPNPCQQADCLMRGQHRMGVVCNLTIDARTNNARNGGVVERTSPSSITKDQHFVVQASAAQSNDVWAQPNHHSTRQPHPHNARLAWINGDVVERTKTPAATKYQHPGVQASAAECSDAWAQLNRHRSTRLTSLIWVPPDPLHPAVTSQPPSLPETTRAPVQQQVAASLDHPPPLLPRPPPSGPPVTSALHSQPPALRRMAGQLSSPPKRRAAVCPPFQSQTTPESRVSQAASSPQPSVPMTTVGPEQRPVPMKRSLSQSVGGLCLPLVPAVPVQPPPTYSQHRSQV